MNCRLCDRNITGKNGLLLYDYNENVETRLGRKINIILNSTGKYENLSNYCCKICSYKIEICFSLLVEIQASDEVIRQTYENLANGKKIDTASQLFICGECKATVSGIKLFIKHYESHILKKTTVGSKRDVAVSEIVSFISKEKKNNMCKNYSTDKIMGYVNGDLQDFNENNSSLNLIRVKNDFEETELLGNDSEIDIERNNETENYTVDADDVDDDDNDDDDDDDDVDVDNDDDVDDNDDVNDEDDDDDVDDDDDGINNSSNNCYDDSDERNDVDDDDDEDDNDIDLDVDDSVYELKPSSPVEFEDYSNFSDLDPTMEDVENEFNEILNKNNNAKNLKDSDNLDAQSEDSFSSDISYKNLVTIVKNELGKFDSEDEALEVIRGENGVYSCESCNISFEYKFILKYHLERNHEAFHDLDISHVKNIKKALENDYDPLLKCCYCKSTFTKSTIKDHVVECRDEYSLNRKMLCQVCGKLFRFRDLEKHLKDHSRIVWPCELCGKKFKAKRFLKSHLGEHDESKKKICEICGKKLLPLSFFSHVMKHREKRHVCQYCGKAFTYNYGLRIHMRVHDNKKLETRPEKKRDKVFCWFCKKDFDCAIALNKHLKNDHNAEGVEQDSRFPCAQCDKKFADMFSLKAHLKLIHEMRDEDIASLKSLPVYRYIECNVCYKVFNSENKIRIHMKQDHGLKPFEMEILKKECEKCGKKFASKQNLIHHINGAHLHIKPMTCDICQEKFAKHSSLIYHKLRHSGEKPFQCEFCQKSYRQRNDVIRHLARHVRDKELTLEEASAVNNSPSRLVIKRRIFLKDSSINYKTIVKKNRRKSEIVKMEPILEEEINEIQEEQMEFNENGISDSMMYVEEVPVDGNQVENSSDMPYINAKPIYDEERNTIILSSPDVVKNSVKNVTYRYIPSLLKHMPAVIVKKQEQI